MKESRSLTQSYWEPERSEPLLDVTLGGLLRQVVAEVPERLALVDSGTAPEQRRSWTYQQLLDTAERVARALLGRFSPGERVARALLGRFSPGERVALCAPNCAEWVLLQHGLHLAGLILVPINPAYRQNEVEAIVRGSGAVGLFHVDRYRNNDILGIADALRGANTSLRETIRLADWDEFIASADDDTALPEAQPEDILQLQYTSGTTGVPKGACLHHRGAINTSRFVAQRAGFPEGGICLNAMPMFHIGGPVVTGMGTLTQRGTYVLMPGFDATQMLDLIERERANITLIVPTMIIALLEHPAFDKRRVESISTILTGAAIVPAALVHRTKQAFGCELSILFGQTEANGVISQTRLDDSVEDQSDTLGQPLPQSEVAIIDTETDEIVPIGEVGEICVRGYQAMLGYYGLEDATRRCIREDGWLRTGDSGMMDSRGYLRISGRLKEMIIRGGMNLYPREIEDVIFDHAAVGQVSVVGLPDDKWGEIVAAVIAPAPEHSGTLPVLDLHEHCRQHLAAHKTPALWFGIETFPMTPSGKIQKFVLQDMIARGELRPIEWDRPKTERGKTQ